MYVDQIVKSVYAPVLYFKILEINGNVTKAEILGSYKENKFIRTLSTMFLASCHSFTLCTKQEEHNVKLIMAENYEKR